MLVELLHPIAVMEHQDEDERKYYHRPSMAGPDRCIRQTVYLAQGGQNEFGGRILHVFNDGHWHEELTNEWIQKSAFTLHSQQMKVKVSMLGLTIGGSIDGVLTDILGIDRLYEHKGLNHFTFEKYWGKEEYPEDYLCQCAIYLRGLQEVNPDIRECLLVIKNKNTAAFLEYLLDYERDTDALTILRKTNHLGETVEIDEQRVSIVTQAFYKFLEIDQHVATGSLPDRPYNYDDWHCEYCSFRDQCWESFKDEVESLAEQEELEPEVADTLRYYKELGAHLNEQKKEREELRDQILSILKAKQAKSGKAGEYLANMNIFPKEKVDWDLVPSSVSRQLDPYRKTSWETRLTIKSLEKNGTKSPGKKGKGKGKIIV